MTSVPGWSTDPQGTSRRWIGGAPPRRGFQRHHLIPLSLQRHAGLAALFAALRAQGFDLRQWHQNGLLLPASEGAALVTGHALHRGPHPAYDDIVRARVDAMERDYRTWRFRDPARAAFATAARLATLQAALGRLLTDCHGLGRWSVRLNRRDPMRLFADRSYLDLAIDRAFGDLAADATTC